MTFPALGLRGRLVLAQVATFALLAIAAGSWSYYWLERSCLEEVDATLATTAATARGMLHADVGANGGDYRTAANRLLGTMLFAEQALVAVDSTGTRVAVSPRLRLAPPTAHLDVRLDARVPRTVSLDGASARVLQYPLDGGLRLYVVHALGPMQDRLARFRFILIVSTGVVLLLGGLISMQLSRQLLRPIVDAARAAERLTSEVKSGAAQLGRLPRLAGNDEFATLSREFNRLLGQLEFAFRRERKTATRFREFLADAAHELRTPIAIVRAEAEAALADSDPTAQRAALTGIIGEVDRLGTLVSDLLALARRDAGGSAPRTRVYLDDLAATVVARLGAHPYAEGRELRLGDFDAAPVQGDRNALERVLVILVHNALVHAAPSPVEISAGVAHTSIGLRSWVRVRDWGPGIPTPQQERIFERFVRLDQERPGTGLGLAIARAIAEEHDGSLTVTSETGGGSVFLLELPADDDTGELALTAPAAPDGSV